MRLINADELKENKCPCDSCHVDYEEEGCCCERYIQWHGMRGEEE